MLALFSPLFNLIFKNEIVKSKRDFNDVVSAIIDFKLPLYEKFLNEQL